MNMYAFHGSKHECGLITQSCSLSGRGMYMRFSSRLLSASSISQGWLVAASTMTSFEASSPVAPTPVVEKRNTY